MTHWGRPNEWRLKSRSLLLACQTHSIMSRNSGLPITCTSEALLQLWSAVPTMSVDLSDLPNAESKLSDKRCLRRRGRRQNIRQCFRRRGNRPLLPGIILSNMTSLQNKIEALWIQRIRPYGTHGNMASSRHGTQYEVGGFSLVHSDRSAHRARNEVEECACLWMKAGVPSSQWDPQCVIPMLNYFA